MPASSSDGLEDEGGELGLMVAIAHQEERLVGIVAFEAIEQAGIVAEAHALAPQILIDFRAHCPGSLQSGTRSGRQR